MEKKIDLREILKNCPKGTKLYSCIHGEVEFSYIDSHAGAWYPIIVTTPISNNQSFTPYGRFSMEYSGECVLFPSKDNRDWSTFVAPKKKVERFNPNTLKPFAQILVRDDHKDVWLPKILSYIDGEGLFVDMSEVAWVYAIPYEGHEMLALCCDAPENEFYRYWWEDEDGQEDA